jgi:hypothetical protein
MVVEIYKSKIAILMRNLDEETRNNLIENSDNVLDLRKGLEYAKKQKIKKVIF